MPKKTDIKKAFYTSPKIFITASLFTALAVGYYNIRKENKELKKEVAQQDEILKQQGKMLAMYERKSSGDSPQCIKMEQRLNYELKNQRELLAHCQKKSKLIKEKFNKTEGLLASCETKRKIKMISVPHGELDKIYRPYLIYPEFHYKFPACLSCSQEEDNLRYDLRSLTGQRKKCEDATNQIASSHKALMDNLKDCEKKLAEETSPPKPADTQRSSSSSGQR